MHYGEITNIIIERDLVSFDGETPHRTVNNILSQSIKKEIDSSFERDGIGIYKLAENLEKSDSPPRGMSSHDEKISSKEGLHGPVGSSSGGNGDFSRFPADKSTDLDRKNQTDEESKGEESKGEETIISSFGMFWRREEVEWTSPTKNLQLLGVPRKKDDSAPVNSAPVNFSQQIGLYLLYDGREVVYVGRAKTGNSTLGGRLYAHTEDRLSARWDRFSWFGFLPVSDNEKPSKLQDSYDLDKMIAEIEAILIEALEPRQNRKRGDNFIWLEYLQKENPTLMEQRIMNAILKLKRP